MDAVAVMLALQLKVGDLVAAPASASCARLSVIDDNPGGVAWAWLELDGNVPRNVVRVRLDQLRPCERSIRPGATGEDTGPSTR